ncbi:MAG: hypothetical protein HRU00_16960 [Myxococcales bacterium]|nr:hypothetical protein [Myxococcales bacterium]
MGNLQGEIQIAQSIERWSPLDHARQSGGRLPVYWRDILNADPYMRNVVMVIELVFGGKAGVAPIRISTERVRSTSALADTKHDALPLIMEEPEFAEEYKVGEGTSTVRSVALTLDPKLVNPAELIARGMILAGIGEVSLEPIDRVSDYDRRYVILRGDMGGGVRFGAVLNEDGDDDGTREVVDVELVDPKESVATKLPPWVVDDSRFSTGVHLSAQGERTPLVVNSYGRIPAVRITTTTPGTQDFIFAWGDLWTVDTTTGVMVNGVEVTSGDATYGWTQLSTTDEKGVTYSYIRFTNAATAWEDNDAVHVTTTATDDQRNIIQVIRHIVESFTPLGVDGASAQLFSDAESRLPLEIVPQILINGASGNSAGSAPDWIEGHLLDSYPMITMVWANGAYGPIYTDFRTEPVAQWELGKFPLLDRILLVQEIPKTELFNEFVYRFDYDPVLNVYQKVLVRGAENSGVCEYSQTLVGERHAEVIESVYVTDEDEAEFVLDWMVDHMALPSYLVECEALPRIFLEYRRGDTISFSAPEFGWVNEPATIEKMTYKRGRVVVGIRVWTRFMNMRGAAASAT